MFLRPEGISRDTRLFAEGTVLFEEGEPGQSFFLIKKGTVLVYREEHGQRIELATLGAGDLFGEMALAGNLPRNASARCLTDCVLSIGERDGLDRLIRSNAQFARQLIELAAKRFHSTTGAMSERLEHAGRLQTLQRIVDYAGFVLILDGLGVERQGPLLELALRRSSMEENAHLKSVRPLVRHALNRRSSISEIPLEARRLALRIFRERRVRVRPGD